jgi:UDP-N-acetyl-D-glucosamine dehydrogenase
VAYKRDIDDVRESPALDVMALLLAKGGRVTYHDPFAPAIDGKHWPGGVDMSSVPLTAEALAAADCVVILTDHRQFDFPHILKHSRVIVDTRNAIKTTHSHVFKIGAPVPTE